jgi:hypothetical protein
MKMQRIREQGRKPGLEKDTVKEKKISGMRNNDRD